MWKDENENEQETSNNCICLWDCFAGRFIGGTLILFWNLLEPKLSFIVHDESFIDNLVDIFRKIWKE